MVLGLFGKPSKNYNLAAINARIITNSMMAAPNPKPYKKYICNRDKA